MMPRFGIIVCRKSRFDNRCSTMISERNETRSGINSDRFVDNNPERV